MHILHILILFCPCIVEYSYINRNNNVQYDIFGPCSNRIHLEVLCHNMSKSISLVKIYECTLCT